MPRRAIADGPVLWITVNIDAVVVDAVELDEFLLGNGQRLRAAAGTGDLDFRLPRERPDVIDGDRTRSPVEVLVVNNPVTVRRSSPSMNLRNGEACSADSGRGPA